MKARRVLIADDHQMFLDGLRLVLSATDRYQVAAEARSGLEALAVLETTDIDIAVLDVSMPELDGAETARQIRERFPRVRILMLSMLSQDALIKRLIRIGIDGFILKENGQKELVTALDAVAAGSKYFSSEVTAAVMDSFNPAVKHSGLNRVKLTDREMEVLRLVAREMTTQEIADRLFVAPSTVITHRKNIMAKLDVRNTAGMIRYALEMGLIE